MLHLRIYIYFAKVWIRTIHSFCCANLRSELLCNNPKIAHTNIGSTHNLLGSRNQTSAICGKKHTIDRVRKAARPSASTKPQSIAHVCVHDRSWVCCRGWPRFGCVILEDCVRIRGLRSKICGSEVCMRDPRIIAQSSDPRFAQHNPRMIRIRTSILCA